MSWVKWKDTTAQEGIISLDIIREAQLLDGYVQGILKTLGKHENYFLRKGILLHKKSGEERIVLPLSMANILAHCYHFSLYGNHSPSCKVLELVRKIWYHPNLEDIIRSKIQNWPLCMHHKPNSSRYLKLGKSRIASMPRSEWKIDLFHGLRKIGKYSSVVCRIWRILSCLASKSLCF